MPAPGIFVIESEDGTNDTEIVSAGIHGDEMAGVHIVDEYLGDVLSGKCEVRKNLLIFFGNLSALGYSRVIEESGNETDNLSRTWNQGLHENPRNYAQKRANTITPQIESVFDAGGEIIATDIHQSFNVPLVNMIRGPNGAVKGETRYNYMMAYPLDNNIERSMRWIYDNTSDIVAGVVFNDMSDPERFTTFSGYIANNGGISGTYEQGEIGYCDGNTYAPQLMRSVAARIAGYQLRKEMRMKFDTWKVAGQLLKEDDSFEFLDRDENPTEEVPIDFLETPQNVAKQNGRLITLQDDQRVVFANSKVNKGDRAGVIIEPLYYPEYSTWMKE